LDIQCCSSIKKIYLGIKELNQPFESPYFMKEMLADVKVLRRELFDDYPHLKQYWPINLQIYQRG